MKKTLWLTLLLITLCIPLSKWIERQTHEFTICGIQSNHIKEWTVPSPTQTDLQEIKQILNQTFTFYKSGGQSFVFLSDDGQYVLKFFRMYRHRLPLNVHRIFSKISQKKAKRLNSEFSSYLLAYQEFKEETGLLFLHLAPTDFLNQSVTLVDNLGIKHLIALDRFPFLLQKKGEVCSEIIPSLVANNQIDEAKQHIQSLLELINSRQQKGIYDYDVFLYNYGFIGKTPILLDPGRLEKIESSQNRFYDEDFALFTARLREAILASPELITFLNEKIRTHP